MNDSGKLVLRLALGGLMLLHGVAKLRGGIGPITGMVTGAGLPSWVAYGVYLGEVVAPLLVIAGWYARIGAGVIAVNMLFAVGLAHRAELFELGRSGGWALQLQGFFFFTAIAISLMGSGRYGLNDR
jgi:putative oxidoreductase